MEDSQSPELIGLRTRLINAQRFADQVSKKNFDLEHRIREITKGTYSVPESAESQSQPPLEAALQNKLDAAQKHIASLQKAAIDSFEEHHIETQGLRQRVNELESERLLSQQASKHPRNIEKALINDLDIIKSDYEQRLEEKNIVIAELKRRLAAHALDRGPGTKDISLASALSGGTSPATANSAAIAQSLGRLQSHHDELERKYDILLQEKRAISRKFSDHLKKWKNFKLWWLKDYERDKREAEADSSDSSNMHSVKRRQRIIAMQQVVDQEGNGGPTALSDLLASATNVLLEHNDCPANNTPTRTANPPFPILSSSGSGTLPTTAFSPDSPKLSGLPELVASGEVAKKPSATQQPKLSNLGTVGGSLLNTSASGIGDIVTSHDGTSAPTSSKVKSHGDATPAIPVLETSAPLKSALEPMSRSSEAGKVDSVPHSSPAPPKGGTTRTPMSPLTTRVNSKPASTPKGSPKVASHRQGPHPVIPGSASRSRPGASIHNVRRIPQEFIDDEETEPELEPDDRPQTPPRPHGTKTPLLHRRLSSPSTTPHRHAKRPRLSNLSHEIKSDMMNMEGDDKDTVGNNSVPGQRRSPSPLPRKIPSSSAVLERRGPGPTPMSREEREQFFLSLKGKTHEEYKKEYAQYKGRGRYAELHASGDEDEDTFARYEIDKSKNDGLDYCYDEVVRKKKDRQKLHGTDCPCCRDYYEAVGPLPPRLKTPLWKSPSPSVSTSSKIGGYRRSRSYSPVSPSRDRGRAIKDHQQEISRHRHHWAPPSTPPDYWTIGFPDTQQTKEINERARIMRAEKRRFIEEDARRSDGRYRKRKK